MTDYTGSVHVSRFMREENAKEICERIYFDEKSRGLADGARLCPL